MAQQIEDGDASQAERDLRAAEQALREALKRGASDEEIRKLMQNLREAARRFAGEMARRPSATATRARQDSNQQAQDLDKMMDRMEETARNGARDQAEAMLDQMQEMFENMRSAREAEESPAERAMRKEMDELGKLMNDQQALRDDTFRSDQRERELKRGQKRASPGQRRSGQEATTVGPRGQDQGEVAPSPTRAAPTRETSSSASGRRRCATGSPKCSAC